MTSGCDRPEGDRENSNALRSADDPYSRTTEDPDPRRLRYQRAAVKIRHKLGLLETTLQHIFMRNGDFAPGLPRHLGASSKGLITDNSSMLEKSLVLRDTRGKLR